MDVGRPTSSDRVDIPAVRPPTNAHPDTDLVEYLMIVVPDADALARLVPALAEMVASAAIRILDLVCVARSDSGGSVTVLELEGVGKLAGLRQVGGEVGDLLSKHDIETASHVLAAGSCALLLVVEDRWAQTLSAAARQAGGRVVGGGRIARKRIEASLETPAVERPDLLASTPRKPPMEDRWAVLLIDPAAQMVALADLVERGLVSPEEYERQRHKVFGE